MTNRTLIAIVSGLFILPCAALATGLAPTPRAAVLAGAVAAALFMFTQPAGARGDFVDAPVRWRLLVGAVGAVAGVFLLTGSLHLLFAEDDWLIRDAVLGDLARQPFPVVYRYDGVDYVLRAPLGMYLAPAIVGRAAGVFAAHIAQFVQNSVLLGAAAYIFAALAPRRAWLFLALFLAFGALDLIGQIDHILQGNGEPLWPPRSLQWWTLYFQFPGVVTQLAWAPNHSAPGWWFAALALLAARGEYDIARLGALTPALALWSPLAVVVAPVLLLALAAQRGFRDFLHWRLWAGVVIALMFLPALSYATIASGTVKSGVLATAPGFWPAYAWFMLLAVPQLAIVFAVRDRLDARLAPLLPPAFAVLFVLPLFLYGPYNDLVMRGSIPSLALLNYAFNSLVVDVDWRQRRGLAALTGSMVAIAAASPLSEIARSLYWPAFPISDCDLMSAWYDIDHRGLPTNYIARVDETPPWLFPDLGAVPPRPFVERACWPEHPLPKEIHPQQR